MSRDIGNGPDVPNFPGDVSAVLDVILAAPEIFGMVDLDHVVYQGGSITGITGLWFVHPLAQDNRVTAILATSSTGPYWIPAFDERANWDYGPQILMVNGTEATAIPNELARTIFESAGGAANLRLLTVIGVRHEDPYLGCGAANRYAAAWLDHELTGAAPPNDDLVDSSGCSVFGPVEGGHHRRRADRPVHPRPLTDATAASVAHRVLPRPTVRVRGLDPIRAAAGSRQVRCREAD